MDSASIRAWSTSSARDDVDIPAGADRVEQAGHVRLGEGHREPPSALLVGKPKISRWPTSVVDAPGFYTTRWDVNVRPSTS